MGDDAGKGDGSRLNTVLQFIGSLLTPLSVALVGFYGSQYLANRQDTETNVRLYAELMSRREDTDSGLRKDMFNSIITNFLEPGKEKRPEQAVLNLELLAYNFHESLDLAPLFKVVYERLNASKQTDETRRLIERLDKATREVMIKQVSILEESGAKADGTIDFEDLKKKQGSLEIINNKVTPKIADKKTPGNDEVAVKIDALNVDPASRSVTFRIYVKQQNFPATDRIYSVGYYDFPMLNNIRLAQGFRCAIVFNEFHPDSQADVTFLYFPGSRASLKEKPYIDEILKDILHTDVVREAK